MGFRRNGKPNFVLCFMLPNTFNEAMTIYLALQLLARSCERPVRDPNEDITLLLLHRRGFAIASCHHEQRSVADYCSNKLEITTPPHFSRLSSKVLYKEDSIVSVASLLPKL